MPLNDRIRMQRGKGHPLRKGSRRVAKQKTQKKMRRQMQRRKER